VPAGGARSRRDSTEIQELFVAAQCDVCMRAAVLLAELLVCLTSFRDYNVLQFCAAAALSTGAVAR